MAQEHSAETPSLVLVDHGKGRLGASGLQHDVAFPTNDLLCAILVLHHRDQCHMVDEIDVYEERDFQLGEAASRGKETAVEGPPAGMVDGGENRRPVLWPERADFDARPIAQHFNPGIPGCFGHWWSPRADWRAER